MKKILMQDFFLGMMIAFTISILAVSLILAVAVGTTVIPVNMVWQAMVLAVLCSLVNLVYRSEKLKFLWQSIIGYFLTTGAIMGCGLVFNWYSYGDNGFDRSGFLLTSFMAYSLCYLVTWLIIWKINAARKEKWNAKLKEYQQSNTLKTE